MQMEVRSPTDRADMDIHFLIIVKHTPRFLHDVDVFFFEDCLIDISMPAVAFI